MKKIFMTLLVILMAINTSLSQENSWTSAGPMGHGPIGVMGDHYHKKGDWMLSYRFMNMQMEGLQDGTEAISGDISRESYMMSPETMQMTMHMLGVMYAPNNNLTLMAMANYLQNDMTMTNRMGGNMNMQSSGLSDISISGMLKLYNKNRKSLHLNIGISIPSGNINQTMTMNEMEMVQPYAMQMGSGTFDPFLGATFLGQKDKYSYGIQAIGKARLAKNTYDYALGNQLKATAWLATSITKKISLSARVNAMAEGAIKGVNPSILRMMSPLGDAANSGRTDVSFHLGANISLPLGFRIAGEVGKPIIQNVNGIQMTKTVNSTLGLQYAF